MQKIKPSASLHVTGTPHYDYYYEDFVGYGKPIDGDSFHKKYGIHPNRKKILITPSNPASHTDQFKENLVNLEKISKIAQTHNYELLLKTYPHDYVLREKDFAFTGVYRRPNTISSEKTQ